MTLRVMQQTSMVSLETMEQRQTDHEALEGQGHGKH